MSFAIDKQNSLSDKFKFVPDGAVVKSIKVLHSGKQVVGLRLFDNFDMEILHVGEEKGDSTQTIDLQWNEYIQGVEFTDQNEDLRFKICKFT